MDNKNISGTNGYVGFIELFVNIEFGFLDPISLSELGVKIRVGEKVGKLLFSPLKVMKNFLIQFK